MADNKCQHVENAQADAVVLGDLGCMLNIEGRLSRRGNRRTRVLHVAEVLAGEDGNEPAAGSGSPPDEPVAGGPERGEARRNPR
jgi:hypothetical protein